MHKNQHTQRKLLNFEFWINGELSKIEQKYFCLGFLWIPRKTGRQNWRWLHFFKVQSGKITVCYRFVLWHQSQIWNNYFTFNESTFLQQLLFLSQQNMISWKLFTFLFCLCLFYRSFKKLQHCRSGPTDYAINMYLKTV